MRRLDDVAALNVGDGAGDLENAVEGASGKMELLHRCAEQALRRRLGEAELLYLRRSHIGIAAQLRPPEPLQLGLLRPFHPLPDLRRCLRRSLLGELLIINVGDLHEDVNAVEQRSAYSLVVAGDLARGALAFPEGVAVIAAGAFVQNVIEQLPAYLANLH